MNSSQNNDITIAELLRFLQENMLTKEESKNFATKDDLKNFATKDDLRALEIKMEQGFSAINTRLDGIDKELEDIKAHLARVEKMAKEDADAAAKEILNLKQRVSMLEKIVLKLQAA